MLRELDDEEVSCKEEADDPKFSRKDLSFQDMEKYNKIPELSKLASMNEVYAAYMKLRTFVNRTNIYRSMKLSEKFGANIFFKRVFFYIFDFFRKINKSCALINLEALTIKLFRFFNAWVSQLQRDQKLKMIGIISPH